MSLIHRYKTSDISQEVYEGILVFIKHFFICYNLLGRLTSNKLTDTVLSSAKNLEVEYTPDVLRKFVNGLVRRLPTLEEFAKNFMSIGYSNINEYHKDTSQKRRAQIALETLEIIESGSQTLDAYTIEHLHPDSADIKNANIGNLVLIEPDINEKLADKPFAEKLTAYQDSRYKTARNIYKRYHDNSSSFSIDSRAKAMARRIYEYIDTQKNELLSLL